MQNLLKSVLGSLKVQAQQFLSHFAKFALWNEVKQMLLTTNHSQSAQGPIFWVDLPRSLALRRSGLVISFQYMYLNEILRGDGYNYSIIVLSIKNSSLLPEFLIITLICEDGDRLCWSEAYVTPTCRWWYSFNNLSLPEALFNCGREKTQAYIWTCLK